MGAENRTPGYIAVLPAKVRYDADLTPNAKLLYAEITALADSSGYCFAFNEYFASLFGLAVKSVSRLISQLGEKGYIVIEVLRDPVSREVTERRIYIDTPPRKKEETPSPQDCGEGPRKNEGTPPRKIAEENNLNKLNIPPISPKGDELSLERFNRFWESYPKGHRDKKQDALKAWRKLKPDEALFEKIMEALRRFKASPRWTKDGGLYIPLPGSWIRGSRWEDESIWDKPETLPVDEEGDWL